MKRIYIAGPMSKGWFGDHMRAAIDAADKLRDVGCAPFIPHLCFFWDLMGHGHTYEQWMAYDFEWLKQCDAVLRLPGESSGADREIVYAKTLSIPVFESLDELIDQLGG